MNKPRSLAPVCRHGLTGLLLLAVLFGTLMPAGLKQGIHSLLGLGIPWPSIGHFVLFGLIAMVAPFGSGLAAERRAILLALLMAVSTEALQQWVPGRHPMLRDVGIDLAGTVAGRFLLWRLLKTGISPREALNA